MMAGDEFYDDEVTSGPIEPPKRRRTVEGCPLCVGTFRESHDASPRCESGKREHCTCDRCF